MLTLRFDIYWPEIRIIFDNPNLSYQKLQNFIKTYKKRVKIECVIMYINYICILST